MTKKVLVSSSFILFAGFLIAQPHWTEFEFRQLQYPNNDFLVGFSSEQNRNDMDLNKLYDRLELFAKGQLSESLISSISVFTELDVSENQGIIDEKYWKNSMSTSKLDVLGIQTDKYYDSKNKTAYVITFAKKEDVLLLYHNRIKGKISEINNKMSVAEKMLTSKDNTNALKTYYDIYPLFRELEEFIAIFFVLNSQLNKYSDINIEEINKIKSNLDLSVNKIKNTNCKNAEELAFLLANSLFIQTGNIRDKIQLSHFTYQDSKMGSTFSRRLHHMLEQKLISEKSYNISTASFNPQIADSNDLKYFITGTYWLEQDKIKVITLLRYINGKAIASAEASISLEWLNNNKVSYLPENFEQAYTNMKAFTENEYISGDLNVEIWTNKGNESLLYTEGERMKLYVRANKECYIRIIYHLSDQSRVLLLDNYYIGSNLVNKVSELPFEFECAGPFGVEVLQLNAQAEAFSKLTTQNIDGYDFITDNLNGILTKTRAFKRIDNKTNMQTEKRLTITTMGL